MPIPAGSSVPDESSVPDGQVVVGRVGKPFGVNGDVYVFADPDLSESFAPLAIYGVVGDSGSLTVDRSRLHAAKLVVGFVGVDDRQAAETLRGAVLLRSRTEVTLDDESVWIEELIGRTVVDPEGDTVGSVATVIDGHAHDYLNITRLDGSQVSIPMVSDLLDWRADPIVVQPIPGLLNLDEAL